MRATYEDETLHAGNNAYGELCKDTEKNFSNESIEWDNTHFTGLEIGTENSGYTSTRNLILLYSNISQNTSGFTCFRSLRAQLMRPTISKPEIPYPGALFNPLTQARF